MEFLHMTKELSGLNKWVLSRWFPTKKSSHACVGKETRQRCVGGGGRKAQPNEDVI